LFFPKLFIGFIIALMVYTTGTSLTIAPLGRIIVETSQEPMGIRMAILQTILSVFAATASLAASVFYNGTSLALGLQFFMTALAACFVYLYEQKHSLTA
jgi:hypothetical protein